MPLVTGNPARQGNGVFKSLSLRKWRQFSELRIDFDERLTVLTGENGTGKSTILRLLAQHLGWPGNLAATPIYRDGLLTFTPDADGIPPAVHPNSEALTVGVIEYSGGHSTKIVVPRAVGGEYEPRFPTPAEVNGIFVSSHRPIFRYQQTGVVQTTPIQAIHAYSNARIEAANRFQPNTGFSSPTFRMKEALISWALFGFGSEILTPSPVAMSAFRGFEELLRTILPTSLGFERLGVEMPEVVLETKTGKFPIEGSSGGVSALIELAWLLHLFTLTHPDEILSIVIDEPENHLHPALQRELMPKLLRAFPDSQIIVATHSPFIVSAEPAARVYALKFDESNKATAQLLEGLEVSGTANDVLRSGLGLDVTVPVWVEEKLTTIAQRFEKAESFDRAFLESVRRELRAAGLEEYAPDVLTRALSSKRGEGDD
ncbi:AAA family ATPase [Micromonospora taraxaci]|uniref:AAA family ATPase n=1 Tax=Micromonospora taraxaci TaxID=1316803 RepID=UPI0033DC0A82